MSLSCYQLVLVCPLVFKVLAPHRATAVQAAAWEDCVWMHRYVRECVCLLASQVHVMKALNAALDAAQATSACTRIFVQVIASQLDFKAHVALHLIAAQVAVQMEFASAS